MTHVSGRYSLTSHLQTAQQLQIISRYGPQLSFKPLWGEILTVVVEIRLPPAPRAVSQISLYATPPVSPRTEHGWTSNNLRYKGKGMRYRSSRCGAKSSQWLWRYVKSHALNIIEKNLRQQQQAEKFTLSDPSMKRYATKRDPEADV